MLRRTRDGSLEWHTDEPVHVARSEQVTTPIYMATFEQWRIAVYGLQFLHWYEEDQCEWIDAVSVELVDDKGRSEWRLPLTAHSWQLLDAVGRQHAGADQLAQTILNGKK